MADLVPVADFSQSLSRSEGEYQPGDICITKDGWYIKIVKVIPGDEIEIVYKEAKRLDDDGNLTWGDRESKYKLDTFNSYKTPIIVARGIDNVAHIEHLAIEAARNPSSLSQNLEPDDETPSLTTTMNHDHLLGLQEAHQAIVNRVTSLQRILERKTRELQRIANDYKIQLQKIQRVIGVIEMYLGVHEEITQIQDGERADMYEPLVIRQQILYMDEEVGDPRPRVGDIRGIDFQSVEDFDSWASRTENLAVILPHEKGIVALKPSRQDRKYSDNLLHNAWINANNAMTYLLIRNGECLYRIWTGIDMGTRLLPSPMELDKAWAEAQKSQWSSDKGKVKDKEFSYRQKGILIQGLIDRTPIFQPMPRMINLFQPETYDDGLVEFIFDDEPSLAPDRPMYHEWKDQINAEIKRGSRVVVSITDPYHQIGDDHRDRYLRYYSNKWNCPPIPNPGIYKIERVQKTKRMFGEREELIILYQPGGTVYTDWYYEAHERRNRVSFILFRRDPFVLNYDKISLDDIEWFISCRYERKNYLDMIPILWELRDRRLAELEWEKDFVKLVTNRLGCPEDAVWDAVEWWKTKNIWKRPIMEDDAKALRMIESRIKRDLERL